MTRKQFLAQVEQIDGWRMTKHGEIRNGRRCPVTKICMELLDMSFSVHQVDRAASKIRLQLGPIGMYGVVGIVDTPEQEITSWFLDPTPELIRNVRRAITFRRQLVRAARLKEIPKEDV